MRRRLVAADGTYRPGPERRAAVVAVTLALGLGVAIRAAHVLSATFPLNDGGMFFAMVRDLQQASYRLPAFTTYNDAQIPFAYSPLGFYLAALLDRLTPLELTDVFRWLPLAATALTVPACWLIARELLATRIAILAAVVTFGVLPRSFIWLLMGGGVTRAPGWLFAMLALWQLARLYTTRDRRYVATAGMLSALTVLTHLGTAPFLAFSAALFCLALARDRFGFATSAAVALLTLLLTAPWWVTVLAVHGVSPFLAANATGGSIFAGVSLQHVLSTLSNSGLGAGEPLLQVGGMFAILGVLASVTTRSWLLPVWWLATVLLDTRAGSTYATLPIALLAGIGVNDVALPLLRRARYRWRRHPAHARPSAPNEIVPLAGARVPATATAVVLGFLLLFGAGSAMLRLPGLPGGISDLVALSRDERWAMRWIARVTPPTSRILVISHKPWQIDKSSEWLPVIGERVSVATVQGSEWLPKGTFRRRESEFNRLQGCAAWLSECLDRWRESTRLDFTHVFIPKANPWQCCRVLLHDLRRRSDYELVYDGPGAVIFAHRPTVLAQQQ